MERLKRTYRKHKLMWPRISARQAADLEELRDGYLKLETTAKRHDFELLAMRRKWETSSYGRSMATINLSNLQN